jgi:hypothetical protein
MNDCGHGGHDDPLHAELCEQFIAMGSDPDMAHEIASEQADAANAAAERWMA